MRFRKDSDGSLHACGLGIYRYRNVAMRRYEYGVVLDGAQAQDTAAQRLRPSSFTSLADAKLEVAHRCRHGRA